MSPEAQRIAIAESCGLGIAYSISVQTIGGRTETGASFVLNDGKTECFWSKDGRLVVMSPGFELPDYLGDLNAMAEAEKWLQQHWGVVGWANYGRLLAKLNHTESWTCPESDAASATSAQRAEAFLRTLNLWKASASFGGMRDGREQRCAQSSLGGKIHE